MGREHSIGASNKSRLAGRNPLRRFVLRSVLPFATLLFGEGADWLKNVLAAGRATIETRGETWAVAEPEVIERETAWPLLPRRARLLFGLAGIERYLKLRRLSEPSSVMVG